MLVRVKVARTSRKFIIEFFILPVEELYGNNIADWLEISSCAQSMLSDPHKRTGCTVLSLSLRQEPVNIRLYPALDVPLGRPGEIPLGGCEVEAAAFVVAWVGAKFYIGVR